MVPYLSAFSLFITALVLISVSAYSLRFREFPAGVSFSISMILCAAWALAYGMQLTSSELSAKFFWYRAFLSIAPFVVVSVVVMVTEYARRDFFNNPKRLLLLLIMPATNLIFIWVKYLFPYVRTQVTPNNSLAFPLISGSPGSWGYLIVIFNYTLIAGAIGFITSLLYKSRSNYFRQNLLWLMALLIPSAADMLFNVANYSILPGYNLAPNLLLVSAGLISLALYRYQWFSITPLARDLTVDQMSDVMLVIDTADRLVDFNPTASRILGLNATNTSTPIQTLLPNWLTIKASFKAGETNTSELNVQQHGQLTTFEALANQVIDPRGQVIGYALTLRDITRRKELEQRLRQLSTAVEHNLSSVIITDPQGLIQYANPMFTQLSGYTLEEARGKNMSLVQSGETPPELYAELWATIRAGKTWRGEMLNRHKNGSVYWEETLISPVFDESGRTCNFLTIKEDISERKSAREDLKKRIKELEIINTASLAAASLIDLDALVTLIGQKLEEAFNVNSVFIAIINPHTQMIETPFWTINHERVVGEPMQLGQGLSSVVINSAKTLLIEHDYPETAKKTGAILKPLPHARQAPRTWLGAPIIAHAACVGVVSVQDYTREFAFSADDIRLLEIIGANIGSAIQNARLYQDLQTELSERVQAEAQARRRAEQMDAINSIGRAISSGLELQGVLSSLRQQCQQLAAVDVFSVVLLDEHTSKFSYLTFIDNGVERTSLPRDMRSPEAGVTGQVLSSASCIYIEDALSPEARQQYNILHTGEQPARSYLGIPLLIDDKPLGVLSVQNYQPHAFSSDQIESMQTIALQAAIALKNARLYEETNRRMREMGMLYQISSALSRDLDLEQVLQKLFETCHAMLPMDAFYVGLYDPNSFELSLPLFWDDNNFRRSASRDIRSTPGMSGEVLLSRRTRYIPDLQNPDVMANYQILHAGGRAVRSYVGVPMIARNNLVGLISMQSFEANIYTPEHIQLLETIAPQAAIALENSRLYQSAQQEILQRSQAQKSLQEANQTLQLQLKRVETLQAELREQAIRDELTGLHNRRHLNEALQQRMERSKSQKLPLSILMIDIDNFKGFNDTYGHHAGDALLQELAVLLRQSTRARDITCRYGGEEFIIVLADTSLEIAEKRAEMLRERFAQMRIAFNEFLLSASISIGIAGYPKHGNSPEELIIQADQAMYAAKFAGRNKVVVWRQ